MSTRENITYQKEVLFHPKVISASNVSTSSIWLGNIARRTSQRVYYSEVDFFLPIEDEFTAKESQRNRPLKVKLKIGETVLLESHQKDQPPYICCIEEIFIHRQAFRQQGIRDPLTLSSQCMLNLRKDVGIRGRWFYRATETEFAGQIWPNEVFFSTHTDENPLESILAFCTIHLLAPGEQIDKLCIPNCEFVCRYAWDNQNKKVVRKSTLLQDYFGVSFGPHRSASRGSPRGSMGSLSVDEDIQDRPSPCVRPQESLRLPSIDVDENNEGIVWKEDWNVEMMEDEKDSEDSNIPSMPSSPKAPSCSSFKTQEKAEQECIFALNMLRHDRKYEVSLSGSQIMEIETRNQPFTDDEHNDMEATLKLLNLRRVCNIRPQKRRRILALEYFSETQGLYPSVIQKQQLAAQTKMSFKIVAKWFANRRKSVSKRLKTHM